MPKWIIKIGIGFHLLGYNASLGPIRYAVWYELSDPFGVGVASAIVFILGCAIALGFPYMVLYLTVGGAFGIFLGFTLICLIYLSCSMKETKGKT